MKNNKLLLSGIAIFILSLLIGLPGTIWGIASSFNSLKHSDGATGIGEVANGIDFAIGCLVISILGFFVSGILITFGGIKLFKTSKLK
jgi:biopolymer transport protein ExbB/TolQ